jgi:uncharacterized protein (TIGR03435 family)
MLKLQDEKGTMLRVLIPALLLALLVCTAHAQSVDAKAEFDVASVKPAAPPVSVSVAGGGNMMVMGAMSGGPGSKDPGRFTGTAICLFDLIRTAYRVRPFQITGPAWLKTELFDVVAKVPKDTTKEQFSLMLQNLLAERFGLVLHKDRKETPGYELVVAKNGPKLKETVDSAAPADGALPAAPPDLSKLKVNEDGYPVVTATSGSNKISSYGARVTESMVGIGMERFASILTSRLARPVNDHTGLTAKYDIVLHYVGEFGLGGAGGPTIMEAVQSQLGLKLEAKKMMGEILVVDHAEKAPTGN